MKESDRRCLMWDLLCLMSARSESQSTAAIARGVRVSGGRGFLDIRLEFVSLWVNERNQCLFWGFYHDCEDLIFYHHIISCSGIFFFSESVRGRERERERPGLFARESLSRQKLPRLESERVPCRQPCLYLLLITQLDASGWR